MFELAQAGDVDAQAALGEHYFDDHEEHYAASFQWNGLAAQAGHIGAQGRLATIYHEGLGVERDPEKAFRWWYSAARQNHRGAQLMVAAAYEVGTVVKAVLPEAAYWASLSYLQCPRRSATIGTRRSLLPVGPEQVERRTKTGAHRAARASDEAGLTGGTSIAAPPPRARQA